MTGTNDRSIELEMVEKVRTFSYIPRLVVSSHEGVCSVMHLSRERVFSRVEWRLGISNTGTRSLHVSGSNDIIPTQGCSWWCADDFCRRNSSRRSSMLLATARNNRGILFKRSFPPPVSFRASLFLFFFFLYLLLSFFFIASLLRSKNRLTLKFWANFGLGWRDVFFRDRIDREDWRNT